MLPGCFSKLLYSFKNHTWLIIYPLETPDMIFAAFKSVPPLLPLLTAFLSRPLFPGSQTQILAHHFSCGKWIRIIDADQLFSIVSI